MTLLTGTLALALGGCLGGGEDDPEPPRSQSPPAQTPSPKPSQPAPAKPLSTAQSSSADADLGGVRLDLLSLNRAGETVVAQIRLVNVIGEEVAVGGGSRFGGNWTKPPPGGFSDVSGFALADSASRRLYTVLRKADGGCVCTDMDALEDSFLDPGAELTVWAAFPAPPAGTQTVTMVNPLGPPFASVPIADGPPPRLPRAQPPDPSTLPLGDPVVLPIRSLADSLDRSRSVAEDDREVDIRLANDVLFALNSARLSPRARGVLQDAARRIQRARARTVRLEGHADTTGDDTINDPLSWRRAEAVARALRPLVGGDVRFTARGFGSRRPIASNDEPEGRRRNRRVSVIFRRPPEPATPTADDPAAQGGAVPGEPAAGKTIEVEGTGASAGDRVTVQLEAFVADGDLATLTYKVSNTGTQETELSVLLGSGLDDTYRFDRQSLMGLSILDRAARQRYFVAAVRVQGDEVCLCSDAAGAHLGLSTLEPGEEARYYATYAVPETAQAVTIELGPKAKLADVAIDRRR